MIFKGKKFLIAGISLSGAAAAQLLLARGAMVSLFDEGERSEIEQFSASGAVDVSHENISVVFKDVYCVVVSPGIPATHRIVEYAKSKDIPVISEIELGYYMYRGAILAVTGTNGKSTVTSLIYHIFKNSGKKANLCGNIGIPFTCFYEEGYDAACCLEVSSFQLEHIKDFKPHISAVLNIDSDHLNRHKTMENYIETKKRIFENQSKTEYTVLNFDCLHCRTLFEQVQANVVWFSVNQTVNGAYLENGMLKYNGENIIHSSDIKLVGLHNVSNCLAAICMCKIYGMKNSEIESGIKSFEGITHRLQFIGNIGGKAFYNDSKATNVNSTLVAVQSAKPDTVLILGGYDKHAEFLSLMKVVKDTPNIDSCVFYGDTGIKFISASSTVGYKKYMYQHSFESAVRQAYKNCKSGGTVLLSPACASFDQFKNFEHRGEAFCVIAEKLKNEID